MILFALNMNLHVFAFEITKSPHTRRVVIYIYTIYPTYFKTCPETNNQCRTLKVASTAHATWHLAPAILDSPALTPLVMPQPLMERDPGHWTGEFTHDRLVGMILSAFGMSLHGFAFEIS